MTKAKRKRFAPLQRHEDKQRAFWFSLGAGIVIIFWILSYV